MAEKGSKPRAERQSSTVDELLKCLICHNEMEETSITPCGHRFCKNCIREWMKRKQDCPHCRRKLTLDSLIDDRSFKDFKKMFKEYKETVEQLEKVQQGKNGGMSVEELGNILQNVIPQRDQDMKNLTDNLMAMKNQEISRLEEIKREQTTTISRLNDENARIKGQLGDELPILTERATHLQETLNTLNAQNSQLKEKVKTLETTVTSLRTNSMQVMEQKKHLEEQLKVKSKEVVTVKAQFDGVNKENMHLKMQLQSTKDDLKSQKEHLEKSEATTAQVKEFVETIFQQKQILDADLESSRQECLQLVEQVKQLEMFERLYYETSQHLVYYNSTLLPNKDTSIDQLQQKCADLLKNLEILTRNNIPFDEHVKILQTEKKKNIQQLEKYYEDEYGTKISLLERRNETMKRQLDEKEIELKNREDVGDELKTATRTYKNLIKENCDLKDKVKTLGTQIRRSLQDTVHYKERANELERKLSATMITIEE